MATARFNLKFNLKEYVDDVRTLTKSNLMGKWTGSTTPKFEKFAIGTLTGWTENYNSGGIKTEITDIDLTACPTDGGGTVDFTGCRIHAWHLANTTTQNIPISLPIWTYGRPLTVHPSDYYPLYGLFSSLLWNGVSGIVAPKYDTVRPESDTLHHYPKNDLPIVSGLCKMIRIQRGYYTFQVTEPNSAVVRYLFVGGPD